MHLNKAHIFPTHPKERNAQLRVLFAILQSQEILIETPLINATPVTRVVMLMQNLK